MFLVKKRAEICMGIARGEQRERPESGGRRSREERKKPEQRSESERERERERERKSAREGARGAALASPRQLFHGSRNDLHALAR